MAPQRRSSRLRGASATPRKPAIYSNQLESLTERDETPKHGSQSVLDSIVSSPLPPRTPATAGRIKPALEEMHPSKAHQSTAQEPDSGLRLGFTDIKTPGNGQSSGVLQQTPSKTGISESSFDFRFARPAPHLGPEAQRMMDELREEALRIKAKLAAEREEKRKEENNNGGIAGRKIAQPKGKVGRFSDVHMSQFKKMDSIAGHPSSFRTQPGRFTPTSNNLKRSPSKAQLDDKEDASFKKVHSSGTNERLENDAPTKRARKRVTDDASSARPVSRGEPMMPSTPTVPRSQPTLASVATPTQASLSRAATIKKVTQIPTLLRSPSKLNMSTPTGLTRSAQTHKSLGTIPRSTSKKVLHTPSKFDRVRSMLRYPSASKSMTKPAPVPSGNPSLSQGQSKPNLDKALPSTPGGIGGSKNAKHVDFTPSTVGKHIVDAVQNSPSPVKSGIPRSTSRINLGMKYKIHQPEVTNSEKDRVQYPSVAGLLSLDAQSHDIEYPSLAGVRPLPDPPVRAASQQPPSVPGIFTFRSDSTIKFGASPQSFGSSPGQSSVRQVRPSILPSSIPGSFPSGNKENQEPLPSVPHGMLNKKRRRADPDDEGEEENDRSPKKQKGPVAEGHMLVAPKLQAENVNERKIATPGKKRGMLSLSRLNMLARPKNRR